MAALWRLPGSGPGALSAGLPRLLPLGAGAAQMLSSKLALRLTQGQLPPFPLSLEPGRELGRRKKGIPAATHFSGIPAATAHIALHLLQQAASQSPPAALPHSHRALLTGALPCLPARCAALCCAAGSGAWHSGAGADGRAAQGGHGACAGGVRGDHTHPGRALRQGRGKARSLTGSS